MTSSWSGCESTMLGKLLSRMSQPSSHIAENLLFVDFVVFLLFVLLFGRCCCRLALVAVVAVAAMRTDPLFARRLWPLLCNIAIWGLCRCNSICSQLPVHTVFHFSIFYIA